VTIRLDEDLVQRVSDVRSTRWSGTCYRHVAGQRDPLSGVGARLTRGRWNPPDTSTIYSRSLSPPAWQSSTGLRGPRASPQSTLLAAAPAAP